MSCRLKGYQLIHSDFLSLSFISLACTSQWFSTPYKPVYYVNSTLFDYSSVGPISSGSRYLNCFNPIFLSPIADISLNYSPHTYNDVILIRIPIPVLWLFRYDNFDIISRLNYKHLGSLSKHISMPISAYLSLTLLRWVRICTIDAKILMLSFSSIILVHVVDE